MSGKSHTTLILLPEAYEALNFCSWSCMVSTLKTYKTLTITSVEADSGFIPRVEIV